MEEGVVHALTALALLEDDADVRDAAKDVLGVSEREEGDTAIEDLDEVVLLSGR
jgi:hypothetical protein